MILQLSLRSPEMTGVIHHSMWQPSVVCGLGLASGGCQGKGMESRMAQQRPEAWQTGCGGVGVVEGAASWAHPSWFCWQRRIADVPQAFLG